MSLYGLTPRPGFERYQVEIGWNPHHTLFCSVVDWSWDEAADPDSPPDFIRLGLLEVILDPAVVVAAVEPYALIPDDLIDRLRADISEHPVRRPASQL
ncbi:hypothetical protein COUCH_11330 [Couchioplanes caeruleus]|uniref:hypothetical protein n=1 Tax=Couchioplanes caeruleus TaxID=56438 RepID=UPI0020BE2E39|nr:hypothetical protein [Couchioplanes caeruleus]UQU66815.1 hypothetical protein COUCH_11330 [Couchioplanes caeruleus]